MNSGILRSFYRCVIESTLTSYITVWYFSCLGTEQQALKQVVRSAQSTIECSLPDIYTRRCRDRAASIVRDSTHPAHGPFSLLPSGRRLCSIWVRITRLKNSSIPDAETVELFYSAMPLNIYYCTFSCCTFK